MSRAGRIALWCGLGATLGWVGFLLINTTLMPYDDEGFLLISLRNYLAGLRLYDEVFSQYGPWPYVYHQLVTTLLGGATLTHTLGRALTLLHWVATALLCGAITWQLTRRHLAAAAATVFVFSLTWQMVSEPSHPGSHLCVLVALAAWGLARLPESPRPRRIAVALGVLAGLALLTKINVGLLLSAGIGCFALRYSAWPERWRWLAWLGAVGLLAVPWVLLGGHLGTGWVQAFAVLFTLSALGILGVTSPQIVAARGEFRPWLVALAATILAIALTCAVVMARGTTLGALVQTVLLNPLRMPARFMVGLEWYPPVVPVALASVAIAGLAVWDLRRDGRLRPLTFWSVAVFRAGTLLMFWRHLPDWPTHFGAFAFGGYCLPLLPVFVIPLAATPEPSRRLAAAGVALVALLQVLHVFPVAGSQIGWATFLCVPLLVAGTWDLGAALAALPAPVGRWLARAGAGAMAIAALSLVVLLGRTGWDRYTTSRPLDLPGAESIRVDGRTWQTLHVLNLNASIHADLLFTRQGMYSHNLWSGVPTPTAQNATHWFWLLDDAQQQAIIGRLAGTERTAFINSVALDRFLVEKQVPVAGPLQDFVEGHYRLLFAHGGYHFNVPAGSAAQPFGLLEVKESANDPTTDHPLLFRTNLLLDGEPARIRLELIDHPWTKGPDLITAATQVVAEPIDRNGRVLGAAIALPAAQPLRGLYRLSIFSPRLPPDLPWQEYALTIRDAGGHVLAEAVK
jgi:hypothetical protein